MNLWKALTLLLPISGVAVAVVDASSSLRGGGAEQDMRELGKDEDDASDGCGGGAIVSPAKYEQICSTVFSYFPFGEIDVKVDVSKVTCSGQRHYTCIGDGADYETLSQYFLTNHGAIKIEGDINSTGMPFCHPPYDENGNFDMSYMSFDYTIIVTPSGHVTMRCDFVI